jgi:small subunit ribosomal protein S6
LTHPRRYETFILLSPNLSPVNLESFKMKVEQILEKGNSKIVNFEDWGRRQLAYPVRKELHGHYVLYDYQAFPATEAELKRNLKLDEQVFKFMTLLLDPKFTDAKYEDVKAKLLAKSQKKESPDAPREGEESLSGTPPETGADAATPEGGEAPAAAAAGGETPATPAPETAAAETAPPEGGQTETAAAETGDSPAGDAETAPPEGARTGTPAAETDTPGEPANEGGAGANPGGE